MRTCVHVGIATLCLAIMASSASALTIDDFSDGGTDDGLSVTVELDAVGNIINDYDHTFERPVADVIGRTRKMELRLQNGRASAQSEAFVQAFLGYLSYNNTDSMDSVLTLTYDSDLVEDLDGDGELIHDTQMLNADLLQGGINTAIEMAILAIDLEGTVDVNVVDGDGTVGNQSKLVNTAGLVSFNFTDFDVAGGSPSDIDWTEIDSIQFVIDPVEAGDMRFRFVPMFGDIVPEPLTMLAVGSAVVGLGGYIRRRRNG